MANLPGIRIRDNGVFGTTIDNPLTSGAVALNSLGLVPLSAVSGDHAMITLDPVRQYGNPEIVMVTAHTAAASVATIQRGMYGTTARSHPQGTLWTHSADDQDFIEVLTSGTRPADPYNGQIIFETDTKAYKAREQVGSAWEDLINPIGVWTSYTPTLTQSGAVTKTVTYARYIKIGRMVTVAVSLAVTGAGTGANSILFGLPLASQSIVTSVPIGSGFVGDASAATNYGGTAILISTTTVGLVAHLGAGLVGSSGPMVAALASGDSVAFFGTYEAAS